MHRKSLFATALTLILAGCNIEIAPGDKKGPELTFTTESNFEGGDEVGIFIERPMLYRNVKAKYDGGKLTTGSKLYWPKDMPKDSAIRFRSASPYDEAFNAAGAVPFSVKVDQSQDADFKASDLRIAETQSSPADNKVEFSFVHRLSKLTVYLKSNNDFEDVTLSSLKPSVYLNFESDLFKTGGSPLEIKGHLSGKSKDGVCAYEFIVVPQSAPLTLTAKAGNAVCKAITTEDFTFEGGKQYKNERLIVVDRSRTHRLSLIEGEWHEPDFSFDDPLPDETELKEATEPGIYTYSLGMVSGVFLSKDPGCQSSVRTESKTSGFSVMNPVEGKVFTLSVSSTSLSTGSKYSATLTSFDIDGIPQTLSSKVSVEKKSGKTVWITDEENGLAYIINTSK